VPNVSAEPGVKLRVHLGGYLRHTCGV
jgi:hypothetical protein